MSVRLFIGSFCMILYERVIRRGSRNYVFLILRHESCRWMFCGLSSMCCPFAHMYDSFLQAILKFFLLSYTLFRAVSFFFKKKTHTHTHTFFLSDLQVGELCWHRGVRRLCFFFLELFFFGFSFFFFSLVQRWDSKGATREKKSGKGSKGEKKRKN